ncbi:MAG: ribonuclease catalytic domain-containing protein [Desulfomonile sp.]|jgi:exoribonuclease-2|nr:ribonuclease catalytic domain-containing protein [Deltaproteobacteria bacterium]
MSFEKNDIIDYYDNRRISCGLVLEADDRRLKILNDQGKEIRIAAGRALIGGRDPQFPLMGSRDEQVLRLRQISGLREDLKNSVNLRELWDVVALETREIDIQDLSELFFGPTKDHHGAASLLRAIFEDRVYFKIRPDAIEIPTPERVEQALIQRQKERERATFSAQCADFLAVLKESTDLRAELAPEGLLTLLEEAALQGSEWKDFKNVKDLFSQAGLPSQWSPLSVLVRLGVWDEDENIRLRAEKIPVDFTPEAESQAIEASEKPLPANVEDLSDEKSITIDSLTTRDLDDALSLSYSGEDYVVGIHIADAGHFVEHDSLLDLEIRQRAVSIYLPEQTIPMIPPVLSEEAASLVAGEVRPAVSIMATFGPDLVLKHYRIVQSVIRVSERLCYEEADERILNRDSEEAAMFAIACASRRRRVAARALIFKDPEMYVHVGEDKTVEVDIRDRESPSQVLVSELMILANSLFAQFLIERNLPGIFRSQPPPLEKVELGEEYDPVLSYRCKKTLARGDIGTSPASHDTLGLDAYTTVTSPLRRYPDLVVQRQIKAGLEKNTPPLDTDELEKILTEISFRMERASLMERERQRYFLLKHLSQNKGEELEAVVLHRFPRFYLVQLTRFGLNAALSAPPSLKLNPYDQAMVRIEKINPRDDRLSLSLVKIL